MYGPSPPPLSGPAHIPPNSSPLPSPITAESLHLSISIIDPQTPLRYGADESCSLDISSTTSTTIATITAVTAWGAMRGLEAFSQLIYGSPSLVAVEIYIADAPIYPHRGLMLYTASNFYAVGDILRTIGGMSQNKMNVFHWHITDSHSFLILPFGLWRYFGDNRRYEPDLAEEDG